MKYYRSLFLGVLFVHSFSSFFSLFCLYLVRIEVHPSFHLLVDKLMLRTIFWIFSSFFKILAFTAQILSCWSLINCSNSASSAFKGSTALSVMLKETSTLHFRGSLHRFASFMPLRQYMKYLEFAKNC